MSEGVWVKVHPDDAGGGLEGLGDWAEITAMTGNPKRYTNIMVDGVEFWAFEWTADGSLTTQDGGLVDALVAGGSFDNGMNKGNSGRLVYGLVIAQTLENIHVGVKATSPSLYSNQTSRLGTAMIAGPSSEVASDSHKTGAAGDAEDILKGLTSSITGSPVEYCQGRVVSTPGSVNQKGTVIVRVPADKVTATGGWV